MKYPAILVTKEKYANSYYVVNSQEDYATAAAKIIRERIAQELILAPTIEELDDALTRQIDRLKTPYDDLTKEQLNLLPESVKTIANTALANKERQVSTYKKEYRKEKKIASLLKQVETAENADEAGKLTTARGGIISIMLLDLFADRDEYGGYDLVTPEPIR